MKIATDLVGAEVALRRATLRIPVVDVRYIASRDSVVGRLRGRDAPLRLVHLDAADSHPNAQAAEYPVVALRRGQAQAVASDPGWTRLRRLPVFARDRAGKIELGNIELVEEALARM
jgi:hypothetical protein